MNMTTITFLSCRLETVQEKFAETADEFERAKRSARKTKQVFEKIRRERFDKFNQCFEKVSDRIDDIYKVMKEQGIILSSCDWNVQILYMIQLYEYKAFSGRR